MRILLNTKMLMCAQKTGVGYYVFNLYNELLKAGIDVVPTLGDRSYSLLSSVSKASARLRATFGKFYPAFVKRAGDSVYRYLNQRETDVSAYSLYHETSLEPLPALKTKSVCNIYDLSFVRYPDYFTSEFAERARVNAGGNAAAADRIIVNTNFIKEEATEILKVPAERIDVIPLAASDFYREAYDPLSGRGDVSRYTEKEYILYVGTVEPRKNLKTLIRAYLGFRKVYDIALVIAGGFGWLYDDIVAYPEELGLGNDVIFTGYVEEGTLRSLYRHAAVFVYPSVYEGFGIPPLEAMTCGVPTILSDIPALREVAGDAAIFFDPSDHEQLQYELGRIWASGSLRQEARERCLRRAEAFSWKKVARETIKTYEKAVNS